MFRFGLLALLPLAPRPMADAASDGTGTLPAAASASPSSANLQRFHEVLETNSRRYFGEDEEAFRSAVDWHHSRLRAKGGKESAAAAAAGDEQASTGGSGTGTFVVFTSHGRAAEAREVLTGALSPSSVTTAAHNREQGGCFLVHAGTDDVDALLQLRDGESNSELEGEGGDGGGGGGGLFEGFVAVPPSLKLAPSLLDLGRIFDGNNASSEDGRPRVISPGKALRRNSGGEGLVVLLLSSPMSTNGGELDRELALVDRWRRDWSSASLDLRSLSFWSDPDGHRACHRHRQHTEEADTEEGLNAAALAAEWDGAAGTVYALAERLGGVSPAEACGWNDVMVAAEGGGSSSASSEWITLRNIGHLLPGQYPNKEALGEPSLGSNGSDEGREREKTACLMGLISFLAAQPEVARVSALPRAELSNAVAGRIVQGASETTSPVWDAGVDGSGQVVQVIDSGVAEGSCFFRNSATTLGPDHGYLRDSDGSLGSGDFQYDLSQRKVVQYIEGTQGSDDYVDDDEDGHGSHVAGSVAGSIYSGWSGPSSCPDGVAGATTDQTAVSCVGRCLAPSVLAEYISDNYFDLDALCPEYECDVYWDNICLSDDRSETLEDAKGVAHGARLAILDLGTSDKLYQALGGTMWEAAAGTGARLHSASWGFPDDPCTVDSAAVSFDQWAYENPEHLLVFAAGNLGDDMSGCSIASPSVAKNSLAVGSSMSGAVRLSSGDMDEVSDFSSKGPTSDGRIKPDVLAPGHYIFSAANGGDGSCELDRNSGTSMSCPIAAGAAALVRQYVVDGFYADDLAARGGLCDAADPVWACDPFSPSGALVKAMLIHSGNAMGGSTDPDGDKGFGRINLEAGMPFDGDGVWALYMEDDDGTTDSTGQVAASEVEERSFTVTDEDAATAVDEGSTSGPGGIRATLVWMDPPATASSSVQLIHDLDLFLEGPDGSVWTMSGKCSGDDASCSLDNRNNVERIVVPASDVTAGTWTVRVSAANGLVEGGPQSYALVVSLPISTGGTSTPTSLPAAAGTPAPVPETTTVPATPAGATPAPTQTTTSDPTAVSSDDAAPTTNPTTPADDTPTPTAGAAAPTSAPTTPPPANGNSDDDAADDDGEDSGFTAGNGLPSPAPTVDPTGTAASTTTPPSPSPSSSSSAEDGSTSFPTAQGGSTSSPSAVTPAPAVVIAAPPAQADEPTPAPAVIIASPGGGGGGDTSSVIVGRADTPSPVAVSSSEEASGIGGTPSPEGEVDASGVSGAARSLGGGAGDARVGVTLRAVSVAGVAAAVVVMAAT